MKAPLSWLKDFVDIDVDIEVLCSKLVSAGFEVEDVVYLGKDIKNVVTGKITDIKAHPNADKLVVCAVDTGSNTLQIVTGASNVFKGAVVPVALDGAKLPGGKTIKTGELRGVKSEGMLCSGGELQITEDNYKNAGADGILILDENETPGKNIVPVLGLDDFVLDISVTANRPDCQSILGIAREIAVTLGKKLKTKKAVYKCDNAANVSDFVSVSVNDTTLCPTYLMTAVKDVKVMPSPLWMRRRLASVGLRGISNMVDITNYVLIEMGQPMHAFDFASVNGGEIIVRRANNDEKIVPFDEKEYTLDSEVLVIADKQRAVGLAGIMGGRNSGITSETKTVVFECAKFNRENIRRSSRRLGLRSDSSARFEKGVDSYTTFEALERAMQLVYELKCGVICKGRVMLTVEDISPTVINFNLSEIDRVLGIDVPLNDVKNILNCLGFKNEITKNVITISVPAYRKDIERPCDIIEEIIRIYGYDKIQNTLLKDASVTKGGKTAFQKMLDKCKDVMVSAGLSEAVTYSFFGKGNFDKIMLDGSDKLRGGIRLLKPLGEELSIMRTTLVPGMLNVLSLNQSRSNAKASLFEVSKVYLPESLPLTELPTEKYFLSIGGYGEGFDFFKLKEIISVMLNKFGCPFEVAASGQPYLHPGVSADITVNGKTVGYFGQVHPTAQQNFGLAVESYVAAVDLDELFKHIRPQARYAAIGKYQASDRDLSLVVDKDAPVGGIIKAVKSASELIENVDLFDVYCGEQVEAGKKSVSLAIKLRSPVKTLSDVEIESVVIAILNALKKEFNAKLR